MHKQIDEGGLQVRQSLLFLIIKKPIDFWAQLMYTTGVGNFLDMLHSVYVCAYQRQDYFLGRRWQNWTRTIF